MTGEPSRVGLCHCQVCRKETGSVGNFFAVWPSGSVSIAGETRSWRLAADHRHFCAHCGSSLCAIVDEANEVEVRMGALDESPSDLEPTYELWTPRREHWLHAIAEAQQFDRNRF
jgi:hypothetical protein